MPWTAQASWQWASGTSSSLREGSTGIWLPQQIQQAEEDTLQLCMPAANL